MDSLFLACHGGGDSVSAIRYAIATKRNRPEIDIEVLCCVRDEVFKPLNYLYGDLVHLFQEAGKEQWGNNLYILHNQHELKKYPHPNKYLILNDLLYFSHPLKIDWKRFGLHPSTARQTRVLTHKWKPEKIISLFLNTITAGYSYNYTADLIEELSAALPDYKIYVPVIERWNNEYTQLYIDLKDEKFNSNVLIDINPDFIKSLDILLKSEYAVSTDCGPMHFAEDIGLPMLVLDPRFGYGPAELPWCRWRAMGLNNSIPISTQPKSVAQLIKTNLTIPETTLIPRYVALHKLGCNWNNELLIKQF